MNLVTTPNRITTLDDLLQIQASITPQVFNALITAIHERDRADIYVGRVTGSCICRIAVGDVAEQFILRFRTPTERDRFMMAFERACACAERNVIKSF
ncbi:hypothetical protein D3P96_05520 [Weissella viridescens]|uniref:Uncharacterized protein n=1 Tax=Weissella viridescens TaxID=1629 RepID=A0A3P2RKA0_WEIVI|nr:hypothetical protein [Weissella viridescens]RRG17858.1 hypothetical protein D3P96_05520 [Weissella viridescens]